MVKPSAGEKSGNYGRFCGHPDGRNSVAVPESLGIFRGSKPFRIFPCGEGRSRQPRIHLLITQVSQPPKHIRAGWEGPAPRVFGQGPHGMGIFLNNQNAEWEAQ